MTTPLKRSDATTYGAAQPAVEVTPQTVTLELRTVRDGFELAEKFSYNNITATCAFSASKEISRDGHLGTSIWRTNYSSCRFDVNEYTCLADFSVEELVATDNESGTILGKETSVKAQTFVCESKK